jgi:AcrR family transcriptional regulator
VPGGRPRDATADDAILRAAAELVAEEGYNRVSMDAVARRAGVARATVYRRWPSKAQLVHEAVFPEPETSALSQPGSLAEYVRGFVAGALAYFARPEATAAIPGLMAEFGFDPDLRPRLADRLDVGARAQLRTVVEHAAADGEIRPEVDSDLVFDLVNGAIVYGLLVSGLSDRPDYAARLADLVVHAVRAPAGQPDEVEE